MHDIYNVDSLLLIILNQKAEERANTLNNLAGALYFEDFESLQRRMAILEGIARGESAALDGRTLSHDEAKAKMKKWLS